MIKRILCILIIVLSVRDFYGQNYYPVSSVSSITVTIKNVGMAIDGKLSGLDGEIRFNPADLATASFSVSVPVNTINTEIAVRDSVLLTSDYLDAKRFPKISFVSKLVTQPVKGGPYIVKGTLVLKGIAKEISIPFTAVPKNDGLVFTGEFKINRLDFKIASESVVLSNNMTVSLVVFAKKG